MIYLNIGILIWLLVGSHHVAYSVGKEWFTPDQKAHPCRTVLDMILTTAFWPLLYFNE